VVIGVIVVGIIAIVAITKNTDIAATIASSAGGVIATIVGAYFGVKIGSDQTKAANDNQKAEAAKAQVYALHLPPQDAELVLRQASAAAAQTVTK